MRVYRNIKYGEYEKNILDIYLPEIQNFKTVVYFHGGGLESGNKSDSNYFEIAKVFVENGYCFVSVEYRMYPEAKFPDYLSDAAKSIAFIYGNNLDNKPPNISPFQQQWVAQRKSEVNGKNCY